ncbi:MAG: response regulator [Planctomycetota bacterium]
MAFHRRGLFRRRSPLHGYLIAFASVLFVLAVTFLISFTALLHEQSPFLFFTVAVMVTAWHGGLKPGLIATAFAVVCGSFFFLEPRFTFRAQTPDEIVRMGMFTLEGLIISLLCGALHASRQQVENALHESRRNLADFLRAQRNYEASEIRFRRLIEAELVGVCVADYKGAILDANDTFLHMLGYTREDLVQRKVNWQAMTPPEHAPRDRESIRQLRDHGKSEPFEKEFFHKNGRRVPVLLGAAQFNAEEERAVCFVLDITEQKRVQRVQNEFLANTSHELRTPMNAILGMTELALGEELSPVLEEYLRTIKDSANHLLQLVNQILDFSKLESGTVELEISTFSLRDMLGDALRAVSFAASEKCLALTSRVAEDIPDIVEGDAVRLRQVLLNFLYNAIKFTDQGEVSAVIELEALVDNQVRLRFAVRDTGVGISNEDKERIFAPFVQGDSSSTRRYGGVGLGLPISAELVRLMGGQLKLQSELGQGSEFSFTIVLPIAPEPAAIGKSEIDQLRGLAVLAVDDNATNRWILKESLKSWSMNPVVLSDGRTALDELRRAVAVGKEIPLVILDALMPGMDGFQLARRIKEDPLLAHSTILMLSSSDHPSHAQRCEEAGVASLLTKPIAQQELLDAILKALKEGENARSRLQEWDRPSLKVLLAEDTPANQRVASLVLSKRGHDVSIVSNGADAVERVRNEAFDVVLMDVQMPVMDGYQATAAIRALDDRDKRTVPIVAMTAHAMQRDRQRCYDAGMDAYLAKPIDAAHLIETVEGIVSRVRPMLRARSTSSPFTSFPPHALLPILDLEGTLARLGGDQELFRELLEHHDMDTPNLRSQLRIAMDAGDANGIEKTAHRIKGIIANFGASRAVASVQKVEELGKAGITPGSRTSARNGRALNALDEASPYRHNGHADDSPTQV